MIQNGQLYRLRWETDVAEIATEQMRVQRQECRIARFDSGGRLFAQDADMGMGWRLRSARSRSKLTNTSMASVSVPGYSTNWLSARLIGQPMPRHTQR